MTAAIARELRSLAGSLSGSVVLPDDPDYPHLRKLFRARPGDEVLPLGVVRCAVAADVAEAIRFATGRGLHFALRSGGHSFADFSSTDGLLIDLSQLCSISLDGALVTVGPGVRLGALADRLAEHRRILPSGWYPLVAVAGAVLGGGFGMLSRQYGLGCDHLLAAEVVLASGRTVWVDADRDPELFWALRGAGGGNFGAVTTLVLRTDPAPPVTTFLHRWRWRHATRVVDSWQRWAPTAPDWLNAELVVQADDTDPEPGVILFGAAIGAAADARPLLTELLGLVGAETELDELSELSPSYAARRHTYAGEPAPTGRPTHLPPGYQPWLRVVKSEFFDRPVPVEAIEALLADFPLDRPPGQRRELELVPWGGALGAVPWHATAFVHRTPSFLIGHQVTINGAAGRAAEQAAHAWVNRSWQTVHPFGSGRVYPNFPDPELAGWARAYYGANLPRLIRAKRRYDPADVFRFAQSIPLR